MKTRAIGSAILSAAAMLAGCGGSDWDGGMAPPRLLASSFVLSGTTAEFSGNRANYTITKSTAGYTVQDTVGSGGSQLVSNVQALKFADMTVNLGIGDKAASLAAADLKLLTELYVAFFNRVPDADGLAYWIDQYKGGMGIDAIAQVFYDAAVQYSALTGYSATMTSADFVKVIYRNVLGRTSVDADGLNYWSNALDNGVETRGTLVKSILNSAHNFKGDATWGMVADLLDNKVTVANYFAVQQGLNYNTSETSISRTMAIAAAVTSTGTSDAVDLVGLADTAFSLTPAYIYYKRYGGTTPRPATIANGVLSIDGKTISGIYFVSGPGGSICIAGGNGSTITACSSPPSSPNVMLLCGPDPVTGAADTLLYVLLDSPASNRVAATTTELHNALQSEDRYLGIGVYSDCSGSYRTSWIRNYPQTNYYLWPDVFTTYSAGHVSSLLNGMPMFRTPAAGSDYTQYTVVRSTASVFEIWH